MSNIIYTPAWTPLKPHREQSRLFYSGARFKVVPAGRRSGKCLAKGTLISLPNGFYKPIEEINVGDSVLSFNIESWRIEEKLVKNIFDNGIRETYKLLSGGKYLIATSNHRILTDCFWAELGDITSFHHVLHNYGQNVYWDLAYLVEYYGEEQTYDLEIEDNHCYVANGFVVHNSELAKRNLVLRALNPYDPNIPRPSKFPDPKYFASAPTWSQAKRIYWQSLLKLIPDWAFEPDRRRGVSNSEMVIRLKSGAEIYVLGLDKPERIEGSPWDGGVLDEYANMKAQAWTMNVRPALADREGWIWAIGVPEGRNHYYEMYQEASMRGKEDREAGKIPLWDAFTWTSEEILPPEEIEAAKRDLDPLTYEQEMRGSFVSFHGQAYYQFNRMFHCTELKYDPKKDLILCFDFNVSPGVAVICQEMLLPGQFEMAVGEDGQLCSRQVFGTGCIGEVYIPKNSNTPAVCRRIMKDWKGHEGKIFVYGDATGGAGGTTAVEGSDWDLVRRTFRMNDSWNNKVYYRVPTINPKERARVNAMNSRLKSSSGIIRMMVDPMKCHYLVRDFEGVRLLEGGSGEIDDRYNPDLTHLTDALGYYIFYEFPTISEKSYSKEIFW